MKPRDLSGLENRLGHRFRDRAILLRALTHSSYAHEEDRGPDNEALEFMGDAALGFLVAEALLNQFPVMDEGGLSKLKSFLVSRTNLAAVAKRLSLGGHLRLGRTMEKGQGRQRGSVLADALEAVIAAIHLDGGDAAARASVVKLFGRQIRRLDRVSVERKDHKTALQEALQARGRPAPRYKVESTDGPPHDPTFHIGLLVDGDLVAHGRGGTKKEAEQRAARRALRVLQRPEGKG